MEVYTTYGWYTTIYEFITFKHMSSKISSIWWGHDVKKTKVKYNVSRSSDKQLGQRGKWGQNKLQKKLASYHKNFQSDISYINENLLNLSFKKCVSKPLF